MSVKQRVEDDIAQHTITIFSKSWCPYCAKAKATLKKIAEDKKIDPEAIKILELDSEDDGAEIQGYLQTKTGQRTVPNIFIKQQHVGGNDDLQAAVTSKKVDELLAA